MQLTTGDEFGEQEHTIWQLQSLDQVHDEGVIVLRKHLDFASDLPWDPPVLLAHPLECVREARGLVSHEMDDPRRAASDHAQPLQVLELEPGVLKPHAIFQLLGGQGLVSDHLTKGVPIERPYLRAGRRGDFDGRGAGLAKEDSALAKVAKTRDLANHLAVDELEGLALHDDVKVSAAVALQDDLLALLVPPPSEPRDEDVKLQLREVSEHADLRQSPRHASMAPIRVLAPRRGAAAAAAIRGQHREAAATLPSDKRRRRITRDGWRLFMQIWRRDCSVPMSAAKPLHGRTAP
mmetsp:Transcript_114831/g.364947  ORF Transcript_114831/g.364947 Transcript_114831/m.364947 type:complete len:293 (+) Transcript_114831:829-1707(+)